MKVSVVCPFFNEEAIIEKAIQGMLASLTKLSVDWELILVNDGSIDNSPDLAELALKETPQAKVVGYPHNRGRGYALKYGVKSASGDIVVTTEVDLSWGEDIVQRFIEAFEVYPDADMIVASPNLPGGGYRNVPFKRVFISKLGNMIIRAGQDGSLSMYTGMTRAYKRKSFLEMSIDETGKEFHLEVAQKAQAYGYKIYEIPCILEWKDHKLLKPGSQQRKSSSKIANLVKTHFIFAAAAAPFRYIFPASIIIFVLSILFFIFSLINLFNETPSIFLLLTGMGLMLVSITLAVLGVLSYQNMFMRNEIWKIRRELYRVKNDIFDEEKQ